MRSLDMPEENCFKQRQATFKLGVSKGVNFCFVLILKDKKMKERENSLLCSHYNLAR